MPESLSPIDGPGYPAVPPGISRSFPISSPEAYLNCGLPPVLELSAASWASWLQGLHSPKLRSSLSALAPTPAPSWSLPTPQSDSHIHRIGWHNTANLVNTWQPQGLLTSHLHKQCNCPQTKAASAHSPLHRRGGSSFAYSQTILMK